ncbi:MAG: hypothetical protein K8F25_06600 [Fimbriimonadaceae bacterium]|nr:hypothetical protein [Alphaproteobacteria bacterium]
MIDLKVYRPEILLIETHMRALSDVIESPIYEFLEVEGYRLFNWVGLTAFYHRADFQV